MAKCQSRALSTRSDEQLKQIKTQRLYGLFPLWLMLCMIGLQHVHANDAGNTHLVMGDVGVIKTNASDASQVTWAQLTPEQKKVLAPLGAEWDTLRPWQREKMLDIARDYPKMDAKKQARVKERLNTWSRMTPYERENARIRYQQFHSLSAEKKDELRKKWAEHQKLPESEREKLRQGSFEYDPDLD
jgi:phage-related tail protein